MPKIVITGAHGFVGRHVVDAILALPNELFSEICVVDRTAALDAHARAVRDARLRFIVADLTDADETAAALRKQKYGLVGTHSAVKVRTPPNPTRAAAGPHTQVPAQAKLQRKT